MTGATVVERAEAALRLADLEPARARGEARMVLAEARRTGDRLAAAQAERALAAAARVEQDMASVDAHLERAVRLAEEAGAVEVAGQARIGRALALGYLGRMRAAHEELDRAASVLHGADLGWVELRRASILYFQGRFEDADDRYGQALPLLARANDRAGLAILYNNRGMLRFRRGALARAEADFRRAITLHLSLDRTAAAAETTHSLGLVAARRGDVIAALAAFDQADGLPSPDGVVDAIGLLDRADALLSARLLAEARATAERALAEQERRRLSAYLAEARLVLARIALCEGRYAEARELAEGSASAFSRQRRPNYRALAAEVLVQAAWQSGERSRALLAASRRAARELERNGFAVAAADARLIAAQVALELGRPASARADLDGLTVPRRLDPAELRARAFQARALMNLAAGDERGAETALRAGMAVLDQHRRALGGTELRVHASAHAAELATLGLRLAARADDPARVLRWAERWHAGALRLRPVRPPRDDELADTLAELRRVASMPPDGAVGRSSASQRAAQAALERRVQRLARQHGITGRSEPKATDPTAWRRAAALRYEQRSVPVAEIQAALGERALVELVDVDGELLAVVLAGRRRTLHRLGPTLAATRQVVTLRFWLRRLLRRSDPPALMRRAVEGYGEAAAALDALLLRPLAARLGERPLVVVPTTTLHTLPWAALPSCAWRPVSVAPSASWWRQAVTAWPHPNGPAREVLVSGPDVPYGADEVEQLRELYPDATRLSGADAAATAVAAALDGADLAHVAAHGTFRADLPLLSSLRLADGPLTVYDLEGLRAAPRLIVLACCDVGLSNVLPGDELMGLAACLLAQGTAALVAPVLPVPDEATHPVMLALHRKLRTGLRPAEALAAVQAELPSGLTALTAAAFGCLGAG